MSMHSLSDVQRESVLRVIAEHKSRPGPLIEILHGVQASLGFVPPGAVPVIAEGLNLSRAEVHGVVTFYHFFRDHPVGRHVVRLCQAESCQAMGASALAAHAKRRLGIDFHETSADGAFTLEPVYCLGNCACSPALMIDGDLLGRVTPQDFDDLVTSNQGRT
jgi:formate dehydrogenase subunit gamma